MNDDSQMKDDSDSAGLKGKLSKEQTKDLLLEVLKGMQEERTNTNLERQRVN